MILHSSSLNTFNIQDTSIQSRHSSSNTSSIIADALRRADAGKVLGFYDENPGPERVDTTLFDIWNWSENSDHCVAYHRLISSDLSAEEVLELYKLDVHPRLGTKYPGNLCPDISPIFDQQDCLMFELGVKDVQYLHQCVDVNRQPNTTGRQYIYDRFVDSRDFVLDLLNNLFQDGLTHYPVTPYFDYNLWFLIKKPLLEEEYFQIKIFLAFSAILACVIILASFLLVTQKPESEKLSTYECGFEPYEDAKNKFDVQFYIVAILFVLFDIEIIILLPWCLSLSTMSLLAYWSVIEFLLELGLGFVYVWCAGALDW